MKTREEVEKLKQKWIAYQDWDIEEAEGFEEYREELLAFREEAEATWKFQKQEEAKRKLRDQFKRADELECSVALVVYLETLEERLTEAMGRIEALESELWFTSNELWFTSQETARYRDQIGETERKLTRLAREIE